VFQLKRRKKMLFGLLIALVSALPPQVAPDFTANLTAGHLDPYSEFGTQFLVWSTSLNRAFLHANGTGYPQELFQLVRNDLNYTTTWSTGGRDCVNVTFSTPQKNAASYFAIPNSAVQFNKNTW
jgi:hypothetical protein